MLDLVVKMLNSGW